ncbi:MAG: hypothetical protein VXX85_06625 [Candidatus Margulisiibacteriota bacterium]|nr:hypothetical protein [Candidatus Margulisiibacteriota bacterium]
MVVKIIALTLVIKLIRAIKFILVWASLIQRLPIYALFLFTSIMGRLLYGVFGFHGFYVKGIKACVKLGFFLRGIRIKWKNPKHKAMLDLHGVHLVNQSDSLMAWALFAYLPYNHLMVVSDEFFNFKAINSFLFLLGFMPQEYGITPENLKSFESRLTPYLAEEYGVWQPVHFEYRDLDALPYAFIMGLKSAVSINIWKLHGAKKLDHVHWLNRRVLVLEWLSSVPISKRMAVSIATFHNTIHTHFGGTDIEQRKRRLRDPKMPPLPSTIARQKILDARALQQGLENESQTP